jgi:hypothetical protein
MDQIEEICLLVEERKRLVMHLFAMVEENELGIFLSSMELRKSHAHYSTLPVCYEAPAPLPKLRTN